MGFYGEGKFDSSLDDKPFMANEGPKLPYHEASDEVDPAKVVAAHGQMADLVDAGGDPEASKLQAAGSHGVRPSDIDALVAQQAEQERKDMEDKL